MLLSETKAELSSDTWSRQCHYSMMLMRRLLVDAQCQFRKMMADNQALASRIDHDIQSAHVQVSVLRAELADTNQRIHNITTMAGNVITTCMPPTNTTTTASIDSTGTRSFSEGQHTSVVRGDVERQQPQPNDGHKGQGGPAAANPPVPPHTKDSTQQNLLSPKRGKKEEKISSGSSPQPVRLPDQRGTSSIPSVPKTDVSSSSNSRQSSADVQSSPPPRTSDRTNEQTDAKQSKERKWSKGLQDSTNSERKDLAEAKGHLQNVLSSSTRSESPSYKQPLTDNSEAVAQSSMSKSCEISARNTSMRDQKEISSKRSTSVKEGNGDQATRDSKTSQVQSKEKGPISTSATTLPESDGCQQTAIETDNDKLKLKFSALQRDLQELQAARDSSIKENSILAERVEHLERELRHSKEALTALKQDRKRLKAEKFDLLTQMKQLYSTLEDKEEELREFIRNYEQKMKETDEKLKKLTLDREECEKEKWNILKRARDEAERSVALCTQLGLKDSQIRELQEEISNLRDRGISSDAETRTLTNGYGSPASISYRMANGIDPRDTPTPTLGSDPTTSSSYGGTPTITIESPHKAHHTLGDSDERRPLLLSRSAEDIFNSSGAIDDSGKKMTKCKERKGTWGSISRVFSRSRQRRKTLDPGIFEGNRTSWSPKSSVTSSPLSEESYMQKLRLLEEARGTPMEHWRASTVLAWLEITMDMTKYGPRCAENIKSGKVLLELSESEMEEGLGITNVMHRRKLRLAIDEHREPSLCPYPKICLMTHSWVVEEWLPSIALTSYLPSFSEHLVDGRVLNTLTKKDLEKHFGITHKFHLLSIMHAIQLLRMMHFDRQIITQRRLNCENMDVDPLVWSSQRLIKWVKSIDLGEYAENLRHSGVHGALMVLEPSFTADTMAAALGIPSSKNIIRRHLTTEFQSLIQPARLSLESERVVARKSEKRLGSTSGSTFGSQGKINSIVPSYARRTLDRPDKRRSSWRFSTWKSSQESLKSTASSSKKSVIERPRMLPLSPQLTASSTPTTTTRHRRTFSSHSDVETLTVTPV